MGAHQGGGKHMLRTRMPPVPVPTWREGGLGKGGGKTVARRWLRATSSPQGVAKRTRIVLPAGEPSYRRQRKPPSVPVCGLRTRLCTARGPVPFEVARATPFDDGEPGATPTVSASQTVTPPSDGRDVGPDISKLVRQWASDKGVVADAWSQVSCGSAPRDLPGWSNRHERHVRLARAPYHSKARRGVDLVHGSTDQGRVARVRRCVFRPFNRSCSGSLLNDKRMHRDGV